MGPKECNKENCILNEGCKCLMYLQIQESLCLRNQQGKSSDCIITK